MVSEHASVGHTGGLGEMVADLAAAQVQLGADVTCVVPCSSATAARLGATGGPGPTVDLPWRQVQVGVAQAHVDGVRLLLVMERDLFDRPHLYGPPSGAYADNHLRYAVFCRVAVALARELRPDTVHAHDWHAGLVPALLAASPGARPRCLFTVHNPRHQGAFPPEHFALTGLPERFASFDGVIHRDWVNTLKAGVQFADVVTTVSRRHAWELTTEEGGFGLHEVFRWRASELYGIVNGIRTDDPVAPDRDRRSLRKALCEQWGVSAPSGPLFGMVTRLTDQKGVDLVAATLDEAVRSLDAGAVLLGSGDPHLAGQLHELALRHPTVGFQEAFAPHLAPQIFAGCDVLLVPSRYEPCGLVQLHAMRHGAIPLVHRTGGLADTVRDLGDRGGWGVVFEPAAPAALQDAMARAAALVADRPRWRRARHRARAVPVGWQGPAEAYLSLSLGEPSSDLKPVGEGADTRGQAR